MKIHLYQDHVNLSESKISGTERSAEQDVANRVCREKCPFCHDIPAHTTKGFISHVGRHMQTICRAAIPQSAMSDDTETIEEVDSDELEENDEEREGRYVQDFLHWLKSPEASRIGCSAFENEEERVYIPLKKLKERLTRRRVKGLLSALFDNKERSAPDVDVVISHYLRAFAILLRIGKGIMIYQFVNHKSLQDERLPFLQEPSEFPSSSQCDIWAAFRQEQWAFCTLTLEYNMGLPIRPDEILPINHKEKIAEGGSSITYRIIVDREYDKLVPPDHAVGWTFFPIQYIFLTDSRTLVISTRTPTY